MSSNRSDQGGHPVSRVTAALGHHSGSVADIARATGMDEEQTLAALTTLASIGRVRLAPLIDLNCSAAGCGSCASAGSCPATSSAASTLHVWSVRPHH